MTAIIFGANGAIGSQVLKLGAQKGFTVIPVTRTSAETLAEKHSVDMVCFCQGGNFNDSITDFDSERHLSMYEDNVMYIIKELNKLVLGQLLADGARICIVSSIWQSLSRENKLSYGVTKSAIEGLVKSISNDLGIRRILVNAVLPGPLDSEMTRANLSPDALSWFEELTPHKRLVTIDEVVEVIWSLIEPTNTCITGNFIDLSLGMSYVRNPRC